MNALKDDRRWSRWRVFWAVVDAVGIGAVHRPDTVMSILCAQAAAAAPPLAVHVVPYERAWLTPRIMYHLSGARLG